MDEHGASQLLYIDAAGAAAGGYARDEDHRLDLCRPALAAAITHDAKRRCSQQVRDLGVIRSSMLIEYHYQHCSMF